MSKTEEYLNQEETLRALLGPDRAQASVSESRKKKKDSRKEEHRNIQEGESSKSRHDRKSIKDHNWTTLNAPIMDVLMEIKRDPTY